MCIAILSPANVRQSKEILTNCWNSNKDGAGYMFAKNGKIIIKKELENFEKFYKMYEEDHSNNSDTPFVIHFRYKTHGSVKHENTHPFIINDELAYCHNGIINISTYNDKSDTRVFAEDVLAYLHKDFLSNPAIQYLIEAAIGSSKLIFLDNKGNPTIIGEHMGVWEKDGSWYSNRGYLSYQGYTKRGIGKQLDMYDDYYDFSGYEYTSKNTIPADEECEYCYSPLVNEKEIKHMCCERCFEYFLATDDYKYENDDCNTNCRL